ncbi:hypothetical protein AAVH_40595, partial [Aphelenchoides avenae]
DAVVDHSLHVPYSGQHVEQFADGDGATVVASMGPHTICPPLEVGEYGEQHESRG